MPLPERTCPTCQSTAAVADRYCSSCGATLPQSDATGEGFRPLVMSPADKPIDLHPLHIVPDTSRQRRRMVRRGLAFLATIVAVSVFLISLWLLGAGEEGAGALGLAIGSGALAVIALGSWANFAVQRARKRARRHDWRMSVS